MRNLLIISVVMFGLVLISTGCSTGDDGTPQPLEKPAPPEEYSELINPLVMDDSTIAAGNQLYQPNCASCHGEDGSGNGPVAQSLDPEPSDLRLSQAESTDGYLFWRIAEGGIGEPFQSSMPGWKSILTDEQIWEIIIYLRSLGE